MVGSVSCGYVAKPMSLSPIMEKRQIKEARTARPRILWTWLGSSLVTNYCFHLLNGAILFVPGTERRAPNDTDSPLRPREMWARQNCIEHQANKRSSSERLKTRFVTTLSLSGWRVVCTSSEIFWIFPFASVIATKKAITTMVEPPLQHFNETPLYPILDGNHSAIISCAQANRESENRIERKLVVWAVYYSRPFY